MAKGKHAIALFEVIQASKNVNKISPTRTPRWWFRAPGTRVAAPIFKSVGDPTLPGPAEVSLDPDRQRVTFHLSYTTAVVAGFAVLVVIVLAYAMGGHKPAVAMNGPTSAAIRSGPVNAGVTDLASSEVAREVNSKSNEPDDATSAAPISQTFAPTAQATAQRVVGRNYIVVQSYPDEKNANEARDLLIKNNIPASVEKGLPGFAQASWFCVVGLTGFDRIRDNPEYEQYQKSIRDLSAKFAGKSKFKQFVPQAVRWKGNGSEARG